MTIKELLQHKVHHRASGNYIILQGFHLSTLKFGKEGATCTFHHLNGGMRSKKIKGVPKSKPYIILHIKAFDPTQIHNSCFALKE